MQRASAKVTVGDRIGGRYLLEALLGNGGMAVVFAARHTTTNRRCAVKIVHPHLVARPKLVELFLREAQVGGRVGANPHLVEVLDAGIDEERGVPFLVMELLEGETLAQWSEREGPMPREMFRDLFEQLAAAVDHAHKGGVVHRDLKPANLFLTRDASGKPKLKVMDFGIAKVLEPELQRSATQVGTPAYAAPEQLGAAIRALAEKNGVHIAAEVSPATDVWATGLVAYELLTGHESGQFWSCENEAEIPMRAVIGARDPASERAGAQKKLLPPGFDAWFAEATNVDAAKRFSAVGVAIADLLALFPAPAPIPSPPASSPVATPIPGAVPSPPPSASSMAAAPSSKAVPAPPPSSPAASSREPSAAASSSTSTGPVSTSSEGAAETAIALPEVARRAIAFLRPHALRIGLGAGALVLLLGGALTVRSVRSSNADAACAATGERCEEACAGGRLASCARLGDGLLRASADDPRAAALYAAACDGGEPKGCTGLGNLIRGGKGGVKRDPLRASAILLAACEKGDPGGCARAGEMLRAGEGLPRDDARSAALFAKACEASDLLSCRELGRAHETGAGVPEDDARAAALYRKACDGHEPHGCGSLGVLIEAGRGGEKQDVALAAVLYREACDKGDPHACDRLGRLWEDGRGGLAKDPARARTLYEKACSDGDAAGCNSVGLFHERGTGGLEKNEAKAAGYYARSCDGGHSQGCVNLGVMLAAGRGIARDEVRATALYRKACDAGNALGCGSLGFQLWMGVGAPKDKAAASDLMRKGCVGGSAWSCDRFKETGGKL